jgi:hypothetical protein
MRWFDCRPPIPQWIGLLYIVSLVRLKPGVIIVIGKYINLDVLLTSSYLKDNYKSARITTGASDGWSYLNLKRVRYDSASKSDHLPGKK